jgi:hypothetical protein
MISVTGLEPSVVDAILQQIAAGHSSHVLTELSRETPEEWEIAISAVPPIPGCYAWSIMGHDETGKSCWVVFRRQSPRVIAAQRRYSQRRRS